MQCYRHPDRETELSCIACERPICVDCMVTAPVGIKCPECAKLPKSARGDVPLPNLVFAVAAGIVLACAVAFIYIVTHGFGFFEIIAGYFVGMGVGELVRKGAGGFRERKVEIVSAVAAGAGFAIPFVLSLLEGVHVAGASAFTLLAAAAAAYGATTRFR